MAGGVVYVARICVRGGCYIAFGSPDELLREARERGGRVVAMAPACPRHDWR